MSALLVRVRCVAAVVAVTVVGLAVAPTAALASPPAHAPQATTASPPPVEVSATSYVRLPAQAAEYTGPLSYNRDDWPHWKDESSPTDCQDAREESLIDEADGPVVFSSSSRCTIVSGRWVDPYTGLTFTRAYVAGDASQSLDTDHLDALGEAHRSGGWSWSTSRRQAYANFLGDGGHLINVQATANRSKGDKDPAEWRPAQRGYWCEYARQWARVKIRWGLSADPAELTALRSMLDTCPVNFTDAASTKAWFGDVTWAAANGYLEGFADGTFRPTQAMTRSAVAWMLFRVAGEPHTDTDPPVYTDVPAYGDQYQAIRWLHASNVMRVPGSTFGPNVTVTRAEMVQMLWVQAGRPAVSGAVTFTDVPATATYRTALRWAMTNRGVAGYPDGTFRPNSPIIRKTAATWLR